MPSSVKVSKNWSEAYFPIVTNAVSSTRVVQLSATYRGITRTFSITVYSSQ